MKKSTYSFFLQILKISFAVSIFIYLLKSGKVDFQKVRGAFFDSHWILLSLFGMGISLFITTWRWRLLLLSQAIDISFKKSLKLVFIGHFFNIVIPGSVSGDIAKAYYLSKNAKDKIKTTLSIIIDRFIGLVSLLVIAFFAVLLNYSFIQSILPLKVLSHILILGLGFFLGALLIFLVKKDFSLSEKWPLFLRRLLQAFWAYRKCLSVIGQASFLTFLNFLVHVIIYYSAVRALGEASLPLSYYFFLLPLGMFTMALPAYGKPVTVGADMITVVQMILVCWALVGLVVYIFHTEKAPQDLAYEQS
ncbi:MAG: flippase-like domain-containing protein [Deltaproteobacteria bacterium]|nr:flippase-like domain-containing protein [Deltaproteobacteria bacterium]